MDGFLTTVGHALLLAFGMFWKTGWSLVLGFAISAVLQAFVSTDQVRRALGRDGAREIALATLAGAASSSCSYASAAISRTLFKKGAALILRLTLVEFGCCLPTERRILEPVEGRQGSLDPADLTQRQGQAVLPRIGAQAPQHQRGRNSAGSD